MFTRDYVTCVIVIGRRSLLKTKNTTNVQLSGLETRAAVLHIYLLLVRVYMRTLFYLPSIRHTEMMSLSINYNVRVEPVL